MRIMKNLNIENYNIKELKSFETKKIDGGSWCSFSYDLGTALRILFDANSGPGAGAAVGADIATYNQQCDE
jgi:hypothetical protein